VLARNSGREDLFLIRGSIGRRGRPRRPGDLPLLAPQGKGATKPLPPVVLSPSLIPPVPRFLNAHAVPRYRLLESRCGSVLRSHAALAGLPEHGTGMI